ncbi:MAG TPA: hypothetical protein VL400_12670 [Polyangiaceae bacterium]|nr:hypothetical protein [Polyangiaceae bacterium]
MTRSVATLGAIVFGATLVAGCGGGPMPPAHWVQGGARLDLPMARSTYEGDPVEIRSRGSWAEIVVDGDVELVLDRVGRVYTKRRQPYAVLESDGRLVGKDDQLLGIVGSANAALPGRANAWISMTPYGQIVKYEGSSGSVVGQWMGCNASPWAAQACVLTTYLLYYRDHGEDELGAAQPGMMTPGFGATMVVAP